MTAPLLLPNTAAELLPLCLEHRDGVVAPHAAPTETRKGLDNGPAFIETSSGRPTAARVAEGSAGGASSRGALLAIGAGFLPPTLP